MQLVPSSNNCYKFHVFSLWPSEKRGVSSIGALGIGWLTDKDTKRDMIWQKDNDTERTPWKRDLWPWPLGHGSHFWQLRTKSIKLSMTLQLRVVSIHNSRNVYNESLSWSEIKLCKNEHFLCTCIHRCAACTLHCTAMWHMNTFRFRAYNKAAGAHDHIRNSELTEVVKV